MADSTYEEATRCPKCSEPGKARLKQPQGGGIMLHHVYCENRRCEWYNTCWIIQVNKDGSVPPPRDHTNSPKEYQGFEFHDHEAAALVRDLEALNKLATEQGGHGEIRRR